MVPLEVSSPASARATTAASSRHHCRDGERCRSNPTQVGRNRAPRACTRIEAHACSLPQGGAKRIADHRGRTSSSVVMRRRGCGSKTTTSSGRTLVAGSGTRGSLLWGCRPRPTPASSDDWMPARAERVRTPGFGDRARQLRGLIRGAGLVPATVGYINRWFPADGGSSHPRHLRRPVSQLA